jgi:hypothetical protein
VVKTVPHEVQRTVASVSSGCTCFTSFLLFGRRRRLAVRQSHRAPTRKVPNGRTPFRIPWSLDSNHDGPLG